MSVKTLESVDTKTTIGNVCFIKDPEEKKILFLKRDRDPMKGLCTGVGGKTKFNEDIRYSCIREAKEETGLDIKDLQLKGVVKTILKGFNSSWILFVYVAKSLKEEFSECNEGELHWEDIKNIHNKKNIIGFIDLLLPNILKEKIFFEGIIIHNIEGEVLKNDLKIYS